MGRLEVRPHYRPATTVMAISLLYPGHFRTSLSIVI
jgi:hypothetical protein